MRPWIGKLAKLRQQGALPLTIRGRRFTYRGLRTIMRCVAQHYHEGRTRISEVICIRLGWRQPNGWLKDRACRDALRRLEKLRLIKLPGRLDGDRTESDSRRVFNADNHALPRGLLKPVTAMPENIELEFAKGNEAEPIWNALVDKYHYLGHRVQVGRCLKYLIRGDGQLLGAISFASPAWKLAIRDELMRQLGFPKEAKARDVVINNSRFLILPKVRVPHLASRVLAAATRKAAEDWRWFYSIEPLIAETFVEPRRFEGTCYRAANWIEIGTTSGYAKVGASHHNSQQPKTMFVYGLTREHRRRLPELTAAIQTAESQ